MQVLILKKRCMRCSYASDIAADRVVGGAFEQAISIAEARIAA